MKWGVTFILCGILIFRFISVASAQTHVNEGVVMAVELSIEQPDLTRGDFFYFLKEGWRKITILFKRDHQKRVDVLLRFSNEYLIESQALASSPSVEKEKMIRRTLRAYEKNLRSFQRALGAIPAGSGAGEVGEAMAKRLVDALLLHARMLDQLSLKIPTISEDVLAAKSFAAKVFVSAALRFLDPYAFAMRARLSLASQEQSWLGRIKDIEILLWLRNNLPDTAQGTIEEELWIALNALSFPEEMPQDPETLSSLSGNPRIHLEILAMLSTKDLPQHLKTIFAARQEALEAIVTIPEDELRERIGEAAGALAAFSAELDFLGIAKEKAPVVFASRREAERHLTTAREFVSQSQNAQALSEIIAVKGLLHAATKHLEELTKTAEETDGETEVLKQETRCLALDDPVCGEDGKTYKNRCFADSAGIPVLRRGACGD